MNQRISEIMRNHGLQKNISEDCQHRIEMIAELIITEAAKVAREYTLKKSGVSENYDGTVYIQEAIKQHFGVE
jgi:hypothetical protein